MHAVRAGALNRRVTIQKRVQGQDDWGQPIDTWQDVATVWANIAGQTGLGTITRMQDNVTASVDRYSIRIRFREDVTFGMRVLGDGRIFDIRQVRMDFAGRDYTDLVCELGGSEG